MQHDRDWSKCNKNLVNRGKIQIWINPQVLKDWRAKKEKKNGHPYVYGNGLIEAMCFIRFKFNLSLREVEGFFLSLVEVMKLPTPIPCYTQLCRRMKTLPLPKELLKRKGVTNIVLDTTGLKIYGEGEWRAEKYGGKKSWKKLHLAMDASSGKLIMAEVSHEHVHDTAYMEKALERSNRRKGKILIDGIADGKPSYELGRKYNKDLLTPPKKGAVLRKEPGYERRNEAIKIIRGLGGDELAKSIWAKITGYSRRAEVESMMARWKRLFSGNLKSRCKERIKKEVQIKAMMINTMIEGMVA